MSWNVRCILAGSLAFAIFAPSLLWIEYQYSLAALLGALLILIVPFVADYFGHVIALTAIGYMSHGRTLHSDELEELLAEAHAKDIMEKNFHGSEDALNTIGEDFPRRPTIEALRSSLIFDVKKLVRAKKTHMLIAVIPISIYEMAHLVPRGMFRYTRGDYDGFWYDAMPFAQDRGYPGWHLVPLTLPKNGRVFLSAHVVVYSIIVHYLVTREWLFEGQTIQCADKCSDNGYVTVSVGSSGIEIGNSAVSRLIAKEHLLRSVGLASPQAEEARR